MNDENHYVLRPKDIEKINEAKAFVDKNYITPPSLNELSKEVKINHSKLKYGFKKTFGKTVYSYIKEQKMNYAKKLLEEGYLMVSEVAKKVGYQSFSHFSYTFKQHFGVNANSIYAQKNNEKRD